LADRLNAAAVGAPLEPGFRIRSPDPALMRSCLALMFAYSPCLVGTLLPRFGKALASGSALGRRLATGTRSEFLGSH
jgi:hypothetical protein